MSATLVCAASGAASNEAVMIVRPAAARWLADQDAKRKGTTQLSARARRDAADEDALVASQDEDAPHDDTPDDDADRQA